MTTTTTTHDQWEPVNGRTELKHLCVQKLQEIPPALLLVSALGALIIVSRGLSDALKR